MYESLKALDALHLNFGTGGQFLINLTLAFIMFGIALGIKLDDFKKIALDPRNAIIGLVGQFIVLPLVTFGLVLVLGSWITPGVAFGMILVAACPGGNISNFISSVAKGNVALSISMTAVSTALALFMTPFNFTFYGRLYSKASHFLRPLEIPVSQVYETVFILLGIPMLVGLLFAWKLPKLTGKIISPIRKLSVLIFISFVVVAFANNFSLFVNHIKYILLIVLIHNALAVTSGYLFSSLFRVSRRTRRTIAIEVGIQNSGLGLVLIFNPKIFPPDLELGGMAFVAGWWGIWHIISGLGLAFLWSKIRVIEEPVQKN